MVTRCNDDILIRPAIDWNRAPDFVRNVFLEYLGVRKNGDPYKRDILFNQGWAVICMWS